MVTPTKDKQTRCPGTAAYPKHGSSTIKPVSAIHFHKLCADAVIKTHEVSFFIRQQQSQFYMYINLIIHLFTCIALFIHKMELKVFHMSNKHKRKKK